MSKTHRLAYPTTKLSDEDKKRFAPMLVDTWSAIAPDVEALLSKRGRVGEIIEMVCDANHPEMYGGMTSDEYRRLSSAYFNPDTQRWLRSVLNY